MNAKYTVFIDESFDGFMNLSRDDGYFCYAALMVPTAKLPDLERFWAANREKLATAYARATGFQPQGEFKSGLLNKLGFETRRTFGDRLARFMAKNDCYVAGFYTTVRSLVMYHLRMEVDDDLSALPREWESMLPSTKQALLVDKPNHPGESLLLLPFFHTVLAITLDWLGSNKTSFAVVYDPREKKEDRYLISRVGELMGRFAGSAEMGSLYRGTTASTPSSQSPGLMLVDLVLRDVRSLFHDVPQLLTEASSIRLVSPSYQGHAMKLVEIGGSPFKFADLHPFSEEVKRCLERPTKNSVLPMYLTRLADQKLSCHAAFGELRTVDFGNLRFESMPD